MQCVCVCVAGVVNGRSTAGREFVVAFPHRHHSVRAGPAAARLHVTSASWQPVHVLVTLPGQVTPALSLLHGCARPGNKS